MVIICALYEEHVEILLKQIDHNAVIQSDFKNSAVV